MWRVICVLCYVMCYVMIMCYVFEILGKKGLVTMNNWMPVLGILGILEIN